METELQKEYRKTQKRMRDPKELQKKIIKRIDEIVREVNETNPAGRTKNYLGAGIGQVESSASKIEKMYPEGEFVGVAEKTRGRKTRSDKGKKREPSEWIKLVKAVQMHEDIPYRDAMKVASEYKRQGYTWRDFD